MSSNEARKKTEKKQFEIFLERRNDTGKIFHFEPSPHKIKKNPPKMSH